MHISDVRRREVVHCLFRIQRWIATMPPRLLRHEDNIMDRRIAFGIRSAAAVALLAGSLGLASAPVMADQNTGLSIGGGVGDYDIRITNAEELGSAIDHYSDHDTAWQGFLQYRFAPYLAVQGQYMDLGSAHSFVGPNVYSTDV